jgi:hypothetical protein
MPWRIIRSHYDPLDLTTLHDDELIAMESALRQAAAEPANEMNPSWRAWQKVLPLAAACTGDGDPVGILPREARASPAWSDYHRAAPAPTPPPSIPPVTGM